MQRVAGLKGDDVGVAGLDQPLADLARIKSQLAEVVARWQAQHLQASRDVQRPPAEHLHDQWMPKVARGKYLVCDLVAIPRVDLLDGEDGQEVVLWRAQGDVGVQVQVRARLDRQRDRDREQVATSQAHLVEYALVVVAAHEAVERRERTRRKQLEVAHRALGQLNAGQPRRVRLQLGGCFVRDNKVHEPVAARRDQTRLGFPHCLRRQDASTVIPRTRPLPGGLARASCATRAPANSPTSGRAGVVKRSSTAMMTCTAVRNSTTPRKLRLSANCPGPRVRAPPARAPAAAAPAQPPRSRSAPTRAGGARPPGGRACVRPRSRHGASTT